MKPKRRPAEDEDPEPVGKEMTPVLKEQEPNKKLKEYFKYKSKSKITRAEKKPKEEEEKEVVEGENDEDFEEPTD